MRWFEEFLQGKTNMMNMDSQLSNRSIVKYGATWFEAMDYDFQLSFSLQTKLNRPPQEDKSSLNHEWLWSRRWD